MKVLLITCLILTSSFSGVHASRNDDDWGLLGYIGAGLVAGTVGVFAAPAVLAGVGFTGAGVAAGSIAAGLQTSATAAGSAFALAQSAGAAGLAVGTQAAMVTAGGVAGAGAAAYKNKNKCDD